MFISKFWTLLLALATGVLLAVILLGKDVVNRERTENATAILYKEMTKVDVALKLHARERIDVLLSVAVDPTVRKLLYTASSNPDRTVKIRDELLAVLRKRNKDLGKYSADLLIALNLNGEVICQVGKNEREYGHNLSGFPVVDAALRGYLRDDIWKITNDIYLVAARPIIDQGRYIGVLVHAMKVTGKLISDLSPSTQLAFFAGNTIMATSTVKARGVAKAQGSHIAKPLDSVLKSDRFKKNGYSDVLKVETPETEFMAVYSRVRGEAAANNVGFALIAPVVQMTSAHEFYEKAGTQDIEALPHFLLILGVILAVGLGWLWNYLEGQRPITKLQKNIAELEKSDPKDQLNIYRFRRRIRKVAASINSLIDYKIRALLESKDAPSKSIDSILGKTDHSRVSSASFKFVETAGDEIPPSPPPAVDDDASKKKQSAPPSVKKSAPPIPSILASAPAQSPTAPPSGPLTESKTQSTPPQVSSEEEQKHFHEIYDEFVSLKKKLGEPVEQLTFERFFGTIKKNRDMLMARYGCNQVKFRVYEKEGKASLKATPVKV
ncbi:MAG: hypothetical protein GY847_34570 [Proteobacteria bacterium]|nr:hypothetical protein [Pseudomonadota bacterium]